MVAPSGCRSNAITLSCLDPAVALRDGFPTGFSFEAFFPALPLVGPRTFFAGFDRAAVRSFRQRGRSVPACLSAFRLRVRGSAAANFPFFEEAQRPGHRIEIRR